MPINQLELPRELGERLEAMARATGAGKNSLVLQALDEWLEDREDAALADEVMAGIRAGTIKVYTAREVWDRLGLGD